MKAEKQSVPEKKGDVPSRHTAMNLLVRAAQAHDAHLAGDGGALAALVQEFNVINASQVQRPKRHLGPLDRYVE